MQILHRLALGSLLLLAAFLGSATAADPAPFESSTHASLPNIPILPVASGYAFSTLTLDCSPALAAVDDAFYLFDSTTAGYTAAVPDVSESEAVSGWTRYTFHIGTQDGLIILHRENLSCVQYSATDAAVVAFSGAIPHTPAAYDIVIEEVDTRTRIVVRPTGALPFISKADSFTVTVVPTVPGAAYLPAASCGTQFVADSAVKITPAAHALNTVSFSAAADADASAPIVFYCAARADSAVVKAAASTAVTTVTVGDQDVVTTFILGNTASSPVRFAYLPASALTTVTTAAGDMAVSLPTPLRGSVGFTLASRATAGGVPARLAWVKASGAVSSPVALSFTSNLPASSLMIATLTAPSDAVAFTLLAHTIAPFFVYNLGLSQAYSAVEGSAALESTYVPHYDVVIANSSYIRIAVKHDNKCVADQSTEFSFSDSTHVSVLAAQTSCKLYADGALISGFFPVNYGANIALTLTLPFAAYASCPSLLEVSCGATAAFAANGVAAGTVSLVLNGVSVVTATSWNMTNFDTAELTFRSYFNKALSRSFVPELSTAAEIETATDALGGYSVVSLPYTLAVSAASTNTFSVQSVTSPVKIYGEYPVIKLVCSNDNAAGTAPALSLVGIVNADGTDMEVISPEWTMAANGLDSSATFVVGQASGLVFLTHFSDADCAILPSSQPDYVGVALAYITSTPHLPLRLAVTLAGTTPSAAATTLTVTPLDRFTVLDPYVRFSIPFLTKVSAAAPAISSDLLKSDATAAHAAFDLGFKSAFVVAQQAPNGVLTVGTSSFALASTANTRLRLIVTVDSVTAANVGLEDSALGGDITFSYSMLPQRANLLPLRQSIYNWVLSYELDTLVRGAFPVFTVNLNYNAAGVISDVNNNVRVPGQIQFSFPMGDANSLLRFEAGLPVYCESPQGIVCSVNTATGVVSLGQNFPSLPIGAESSEQEIARFRNYQVRLFGARLAGTAFTLTPGSALPPVAADIGVALSAPSAATAGAQSPLAVDRDSHPVPVYVLPAAAVNMGSTLALICPHSDDLTTAGVVLYDGAFATKPVAVETNTELSSLFPGSAIAVTFVDLASAKAFALFTHRQQTCLARFLRSRADFVTDDSSAAFPLFTVQHLQSATITVANAAAATAPAPAGDTDAPAKPVLAMSAPVATETVTVTVSPQFSYTFFSRGDSFTLSGPFFVHAPVICAAVGSSARIGVTAAVTNDAGLRIELGSNTFPGEAFAVACTGVSVAAAHNNNNNAVVPVAGVFAPVAGTKLSFTVRSHASSLFTLNTVALLPYAAPVPVLPASTFALTLATPYADTETEVLLQLTALPGKLVAGDRVTVAFPAAVYVPILPTQGSVACSTVNAGAEVALTVTKAGEAQFAVVAGVVAKDATLTCGPVRTAPGVYSGLDAAAPVAAVTVRGLVNGKLSTRATAAGVALPALTLLPDALELSSASIAPATGSVFIAGKQDETLLVTLPALPVALPAGAEIAVTAALLRDADIACAVLGDFATAFPAVKVDGSTGKVSASAITAVPASAKAIVIRCENVDIPSKFAAASAAAGSFAVTATASLAPRQYVLAKGAVSAAAIRGSGSVSSSFSAAAVGEAGKMKFLFSDMAVFNYKSWLWGSLFDGYKIEKLPNMELEFEVALPATVKPLASGFSCVMDPYSIQLPGVTVSLASVNVAANTFRFKTVGPIDGDGLAVVCANLVAAASAPHVAAPVVTAYVAGVAEPIFQAVHSGRATYAPFAPVGAAEVAASFAPVGLVASASRFSLVFTMPKYLALEQGSVVSVTLGPSAAVSVAGAVTCSLGAAAYNAEQRALTVIVAKTTAANAAVALTCSGFVNNESEVDANVVGNTATVRVLTAAGNVVVDAVAVPFGAVTAARFTAQVSAGAPLQASDIDPKLEALKAYYIEGYKPRTALLAPTDSVTITIGSLARVITAAGEVHITLPAAFQYSHTVATDLAVDCYNATLPLLDAVPIATARIAKTTAQGTQLKLSFKAGLDARAAPSASSSVVCVGITRPAGITTSTVTSATVYTSQHAVVARSSSVILAAIGVPSIGTEYAYLMPDLTVAGESTTTAYTLSLAPLSVAIPAGAVVDFRLPAVVSASGDIECQALKWNKKVSALTVSVPANNGGFTESTTVALTFKSAVDAIADAPFRIRCTGLTVPTTAFEGSLENIIISNAAGAPIAQIPSVQVPAVSAVKQGTNVVTMTLSIISTTLLTKPVLNAIRLEYQRRLPGSDFADIVVKSQKLVYTGAVGTTDAALDAAAQTGTPTHVELELTFAVAAKMTEGDVKAQLAAKQDELNTAVSNVADKPVLRASALSTAVVPASCSNGVKDGTETATDCGGSDGCNACSLLYSCEIDTDCVTATCDSTLKCANPNSAATAALSAAVAVLVAIAVAAVGF